MTQSAHARRGKSGRIEGGRLLTLPVRSSVELDRSHRSYSPAAPRYGAANGTTATQYRAVQNTACTSVNSRRTWRPKVPTLVETDIQTWAALVRRAEYGYPILFDCPCCNGADALESRDRLEPVIRRGGKPGRRVAATVKLLDQRFESATFPSPVRSVRSEWWHNRTWS